MKFFLNFYEWLRKTIRPPSAFSWETMILLSIFSYYMTWLASTSLLKDLLSNFAWIFLIIGVHWGTTSANQLRIGYDPTIPRDGFPVSPWITGALVSLYIFGAWTGEVGREALIYWPTISALIAIMPAFLGETSDGGLTFKKAPLNTRQNIVVLVLTQLLLSCWFQFHFVAQDWLAQYPSVLSDNFNDSSFVVKFLPPDTAEQPRGALILNTMEPQLNQQLNGKPWPEVERLLLKEERNKLVDKIQAQAVKQVTPVDEDEFWDVTPNVSSRKGGGYNLNLQANWLGPRAKQDVPSVVKPCQVTQVVTPAKSPATKPINTKQGRPGTPFSRFKCDPVQGWGINKSTVGNDTFIQ
ncbi:MAG: DUF5357 family protein [Coleofasciculaceae cyanobacterium]